MVVDCARRREGGRQGSSRGNIGRRWKGGVRGRLCEDVTSAPLSVRGGARASQAMKEHARGHHTAGTARKIPHAYDSTAIAIR